MIKKRLAKWSTRIKDRINSEENIGNSTDKTTKRAHINKYNSKKRTYPHPATAKM